MTTILRFIWNSYTRPFVILWSLGHPTNSVGWYLTGYFSSGMTAVLLTILMVPLALFSGLGWLGLVLVIMPLFRVAYVCCDRGTSLSVWGKDSPYYHERSN